jgi:hypothetical protein
MKNISQELQDAIYSYLNNKESPKIEVAAGKDFLTLFFKTENISVRNTSSTLHKLITKLQTPISMNLEFEIGNKINPRIIPSNFFEIPLDVIKGFFNAFF